MKRALSSLLAALLLAQASLPAAWAGEKTGPAAEGPAAPSAVQGVPRLDAVPMSLAPEVEVPGAAAPDAVAAPQAAPSASSLAGPQAAEAAQDASAAASASPQGQASLTALSRDQTVASVVSGAPAAEAASRQLFDKQHAAGPQAAAVAGLAGSSSAGRLQRVSSFHVPADVGVEAAAFPRGTVFTVFRGHDVPDRLEAARHQLERASPSADDAAEAAKQLESAASKLEAGRAKLQDADAHLARVKAAQAAVARGAYAEALSAIDAARAALPADVDERLALAMLDMRLARMKLPPVRHERRASPGDDHPTVAILAPASFDKMTVVREGGRQSSGDVHLVLDPSWLIKAETAEHRDKLLLKKGLVFDATGTQATIVEYDTPRLVRYFGDFFTLGANDRSDGVPLEAYLDTPTSSSVQSEPVTNDKLRTRLLAAAAKYGVPVTLALAMPASPMISMARRLGGDQKLVRAERLPGTRAGVEEALTSYLGQYKGTEVVIKPSGPQFHSGRGVKIFQRTELAAMVDHVLGLERDAQMTPDGAVLVDSRVSPPPLYIRTGESDDGSFGFLGRVETPVRVLGRDEIASAEPWEKKDWNFRVEVARHPSGNAVTTGIFARAGTWGGPTTAEAADPRNNAAVVSFDMVVSALQKQHGLLKTQAEIERFRADLEAMGEGVMKAIWSDEAKRAPANNEARQAQTDFIGLDVMVELENGRLKPKLIEVNDHDSGGMYELDGFQRHDEGLGVREWVQTMLVRASRDAMKGKRIVLVGAGYANKKPFLETAKKLGVKVVLVDRAVVEGQANWAKELVDELVDVDLSKNPQAGLRAAAAKLNELAERTGKLDGITTYWEDDVVETALLARLLHLRYIPVDTADIARSKHRSIAELTRMGVLNRRTHKIASRADLERLVERGELPAKWFLKPDAGAEAQFTAKYKDGPVLEVYDRLSAKIAQSDDPVFKENHSFTLTDYLEGNEWDYNVVVQNGQLLDHRPTDNWPTRAHSSKATGSSLPPRAMTLDEQQAARELSKKIVMALGIKDAVLHVEGIGKDLLEVNLRPGGSYTLEWNRRVWGVDEAEMLLMTAAGVRAFPAMPRKPFTHLEGAFVFTPLRGRVKKIGLTEAARKAGLHVLIEKKPGKLVTDDEDRVAMVYADGRSNAEALAKLGSDPSLWLELEVEPVR